MAAGNRAPSLSALEDLRSKARFLAESGTLPACQIAVALDGELLAFEAFGEATTEDRFLIFSVTKAFAAAAAWIAMGDTVVAEDSRVVEFIPEFAENNKAAVTVGHLLTHTSGFPNAPMRPAEGADRESRVKRFATWRLDHEPGTQFAYHYSSAHWVLGEVVEQVTGSGFAAFLRERVLGPLAIEDFDLGLPREPGARVVDIVVGPRPTPEEMEDRYGTAVDLSRVMPELSPRILGAYNEPLVRAAASPGAGGIATAAAVAMFFQGLLRNPQRLFDPGILTRGTEQILVSHVDPTTTARANRTLGLVIAGDDGLGGVRGFGAHAGPRSFGHPGTGGQVAWADPDSGLSFCFLTNGISGDPIRSYGFGHELSDLAARIAM